MTDCRIPILHFSNDVVRGGVEEYVLTLLRKLDRDRFRLYFVCTPAVAQLLAGDVPADVEMIPLSLTSPRHILSAAALAGILRQRNIRILHSHQFHSSLFASPIGRICRIPVIMETPHIREYWRTGLKAHYSIDRLVARCVDCYIAVSSANACYLAETKKIPAHKISIIHFGCDLDRFDPARHPPAGLRNSLGFTAADIVLVAIGRLEPQKGHAILLEALRNARHILPNLKLVCVGEGPLRGDLETRAHALGLNQSVHFVGFQTNVSDWLALAEFSVLSSSFEGLPLVTIESLAMRRPVVATDVDGTSEVVVHGKTGLLVPPADAAGLASAIVQMGSDAALRKRLGEMGREWVLKNFTQKRFIQKCEALYLSAWEAACQKHNVRAN